jgi:acetyl/propionyl-CoA carboxylase alpha subunit
VVSDSYDPLLAKVLVVAEDRPRAIARLERALDELEVGGIQTTLPFHRWLLRHPGFAQATDLSTDLVDRTWRPTELVSAAALRAAELAARAALASVPQRGGSPLRGAPAARAADVDGWWQAGIDEATDRLS